MSDFDNRSIREAFELVDRRKAVHAKGLAQSVIFKSRQRKLLLVKSSIAGALLVGCAWMGCCFVWRYRNSLYRLVFT